MRVWAQPVGRVVGDVGDNSQAQQRKAGSDQRRKRDDDPADPVTPRRPRCREGLGGGPSLRHGVEVRVRHGEDNQKVNRSGNWATMPVASVSESSRIASWILS